MKVWFCAMMGTFMALIILNCENKKSVTQQQKSDSLMAVIRIMGEEIDFLKKDNSQLKETADYHYRSGMDLLQKKKYEDAKREFTSVVEKYPLSPLKNLAKSQITQIEIKIKNLNDEIAKLEKEEYARKSEKEKFDLMKETRYNDIVLNPDAYLFKKIKMKGRFFAKSPDRMSFKIINGDNYVEVFFEKLPISMQRTILDKDDFCKDRVIVRGTVSNYLNNFGSYFIQADYVEFR